jgi:hypothetical protein
MKYHWLVLLFILVSMPARAVYEPTQQPQQPFQEPQAAAQPAQSPDSVEEPDAPDDDSTGMPVEQIPGGAENPPAVPVKPQTVPAAPPVGNTDYDKVVLQGLNKVTARAVTIEAPLGSVQRFGTIEIVAHRCWKAAPEERPENAALLEISEIKQGETPKQIFLGWMFSSSPGLSSLEHPFYDVTVVRCEKAEAPAPAPAPVPEKPVRKNKKTGK